LGGFGIIVASGLLAVVAQRWCPRLQFPNVTPEPRPVVTATMQTVAEVKLITTGNYTSHPSPNYISISLVYQIQYKYHTLMDISMKLMI
jgi:hypothetical protein